MGTIPETSNPEADLKPTGRGDFVQVLILSFSLMLLFTAFQTTGIIEETVLQSLRNESTTCVNGSGTVTMVDEGVCPDGSSLSVKFTGNGYTSLSIIYACFSIASWIAPSVVSLLFPKWSMISTGTIYVAFIASFLVPTVWLLYLLSAMLGVAAAVFWTAHGSFISWISTPETITRNSGVVWAISSMSLFFGNLLFYWQLRGKAVIDSYLRATIFIPLTIVGLTGICLMSFFKNLKQAPELVEETFPSENLEEAEGECEESGAVETKPKDSAGTTAFSAFTVSLRLFITPHMLLLSLSAMYSGFEYSFLSGVYSTAVGNTQRLGVDSKKLVGLVGILVGVGEILGGSIFGLLGTRTTKKGKTAIVLVGAAAHFLSFICIYFNIPDEATLRPSLDASFFETPSENLALVCALLLGFGDACLQTQLISIYASVYTDKSAPAFAIFKFMQSGASAAAFYSSSYLGIFYQMTFLFCSCVVSSISFFLVEWRTGQLKLEVEEENENTKLEAPVTEEAP